MSLGAACWLIEQGMTGFIIRRCPCDYVSPGLRMDFETGPSSLSLTAHLSLCPQLLSQAWRATSQYQYQNVSTGIPPNRTLHIARERASLPEKFFLRGEAVCCEGWTHGACLCHASIPRNVRQAMTCCRQKSMRIRKCICGRDGNNPKVHPAR
jgi:hypothetical protein